MRTVFPRCDVLACESSDNRRKKHEVDERWIELCSASFANHADGVVNASSLSVAPAVRDRIECVGDGNDARFQRNALATEAARISGAVPALMM